MKKIQKVIATALFSVFCFGTLSAFSVENIINEKTKKSAKNTNEALLKAAEEITPEEEYYIGRAVAAQILTRYKPLNNQQLQTYLNRICSTLVINSSKPELYNGYHVMVLDSSEVNAFATPGGHILLTKGIIKCTENEEELAAVIAHEIGHIQLQHALKAIKSTRTKAALTAAGQTVVYAVGNEKLDEMVDTFNADIGEIVNTMTTNGYSKQQEFDADNAALALLAASGYDTDGLLGMLNELKKNQDVAAGGMYTTHPSPDNRIRNVKLRGSKYPIVKTTQARVNRYKANVKGL
ncbi:MAG: M48 family metalloprotease [Treponemataceae bacterium]|nr:M48 family metalloprotease [Treponemataceae bacterium]